MSPTSGTLYIVATPIGNLEDITLRALRILREVDVVAAEDTRHTRKLLSAHNIRRPLLSYREHNMRTQGTRLVRQLLAGESVALVTDAGTPGISDPGIDLVRQAALHEIKVSPVPGPSAVTTALTVAGLPVRYFLFLGYPPNRTTHRRRFFAKHAAAEETLILFESPRRLGACLQDMKKIWGNRQVVVAREMTKVYEEIFRGDLVEAIERWPTSTRGEVTIVVAGAGGGKSIADDSLAAELKRHLLSDSRQFKEIVAEVAQERGISKRLVYQEALKIKKKLAKTAES
jgi:16S rRNA (cytidine1402-2'-O)-methyltransferase